MCVYCCIVCGKFCNKWSRIVDFCFMRIIYLGRVDLWNIEIDLFLLLDLILYEKNNEIFFGVYLINIV